MDNINNYYERYKIFWMKEHHYSIRDVLTALSDVIASMVKETPFTDVFDYWEKNVGFSGEIWESRTEFQEYIYPNKAVMAELLNEDEYREYIFTNETMLFENILFEKDASKIVDICFGITNVICPRYRVYADSEEEALDKLMDYFVADDQRGMYLTHDEVGENEENYISCGNYGYYFQIPCISITEREEFYHGSETNQRNPA